MSTREVHVGNNLDHDLVLEGDVAIVGSGAGGAISAEILARAGLRVLIVEEGAYPTPEEFTLREVPSFARLYNDGGVRPTKDGAIAIVQGRTVGGSTTVNWTSSFRTPEPTLNYWRDHLGIQGLELEAMAPWFETMEQRLHIAPWETHNLNNELLARGAAKLGWRHGVIKRNVRGCANLGYCGVGCPIGAKQSMDVTAIPDALDHGAALVTRVRAERLQLSGDRITAVEGLALDARGVRPTGRRVSLRAPWIIVAAAALSSPALLMRSKLPDPYERIGKRTFLQTHNYSLAFMPEVVDPFSGVQQSIYMDQLTWRDGVAGRAGFNMEAAGAQPVVTMNFWKGIGSEMSEFARRLRHLHTLVSQIRDGFHPDSPGGEVHLRDDGGAVLDYPINEYIWDGVRSSYLAMAECQFAAGAESVHPACSDAQWYRNWSEARAGISALRLRSSSVFLNSTHPLGGCAMGPDPRASVVDAFGRHHHVANLAVFDGSVFPTSLGVNPCLSIYALTARNATALAERIAGRAIS
ncbi:MAG: GMC family oxidoreductase [Deltaproteobacteria bacterium]|nr:GMC family oxidoreductase [Deltaproteobacteria bacterium]